MAAFDDPADAVAGASPPNALFCPRDENPIPVSEITAEPDAATCDHAVHQWQFTSLESITAGCVCLVHR